MKKYQRKNRAHYIGALVFILISTIFAVVLQFFKGDVLDHAIVEDAAATLRYAALLIVSILGEVLFYYFYKRSGAKFSVECTRLLKHDIFESILRQYYVTYKEKQQGEYVAKYVGEADMIKSRYFQMLPLFWEILLKIIFVSFALFLLDLRIALITILLLTTPLYIPKLIEKRLQKAQTEYLKTVEENLAKVNDWLSGFEIIKNFSIERQILLKFDESNTLSIAINLLLRYYDVASGKITVDGVPITEYGSTYSAITVVRQEAVLFHETLRNNLTMYCSVSDEELIKMLQSLGLGRFANLQSLDAVITENGANLSDGEKKRICLARALLRNTDVLILDEPLANLDESTAGKIEDLILSVSGKLLIVVSYQFSEEKLRSFDNVIALGTQ